jgi:hypothetical protein
MPADDSIWRRSWYPVAFLKDLPRDRPPHSLACSYGSNSRRPSQSAVTGMVLSDLDFGKVFAPDPNHDGASSK